MTRTIVPLAAVLFLWLALPYQRAHGDAAPPLVLERTIPLPGVTGRIDHLAADPDRGRLFVAELGNNTVDVLDLATGAILHRVSGLNEPQGVGYVPRSGLLAVANGGDGSVRLFRDADMAPAERIDLGDDADNVRVDQGSGLIAVGYGRGGLALIRPPYAAVNARIPLPAHPEGFQITPDGRRALVNVPDAHAIAVLDLAAARQVATWPLPQVRGNFPMALDKDGATLAVVSRSPPRLLLIDAANGRTIAAAPACGDADDVAFDAVRQRIYVSCGDGHVGVWRYAGGAVTHMASIRTSSGARTFLFIPGMDRLFVAARAGVLGLGDDAAILVFRPTD